jgi:hypothetical protein
MVSGFYISIPEKLLTRPLTCLVGSHSMLAKDIDRHIYLPEWP